jgi:hypothetical protein
MFLLVLLIVIPIQGRSAVDYVMAPPINLLITLLL